MGCGEGIHPRFRAAVQADFARCGQNGGIRALTWPPQPKPDFRYWAGKSAFFGSVRPASPSGCEGRIRKVRVGETWPLPKAGFSPTIRKRHVFEMQPALERWQGSPLLEHLSAKWKDLFGTACM